MLVAMADRDMAVTKDKALARRMTPSVAPRPAWPTSQPMRKKTMTPRMVWKVGTKTPAKVPNRAEGL